MEIRTGVFHLDKMTPKNGDDSPGWALRQAWGETETQENEESLANPLRASDVLAASRVDGQHV